MERISGLVCSLISGVECLARLCLNWGEAGVQVELGRW